MKINRFGMSLAVGYLCILFLCLVFGVSITDDDKGRYVVLQLPIAIQISALASLGWASHLQSWGWTTAYLVIGGGSAGVLYLLGSFGSKLLSKILRWLLGQAGSN